MPATFILLVRKNRQIIITSLLFFIAVAVIILGTLRRDLFYPDETRIVYIARHISEANPLIIKFGPQKYYQKPPFYFWLVSPLAHLKLNIAKVALVLFNVILAFILAKINVSFLRKENSSAAALSFWLIITSSIYFSMSVIIRMDMLYNLFLSLSLIIFYLGYKRERRVLFVLSGIFSFLACFTKGGFGFFIPFVSTLLFALWRKKVFLWKGFLISWFCAVGFILAWLIGFNLADPGYLRHMLFIQTWGRAFAPFAHARGVFYYFLFFGAAFFPWSLLLFPYFYHFSIRKIAEWEMFYLCWIGGGILVLTLIQSKNVMYLLPLTVPVASLAAVELARDKKKRLAMIYILFGSLFFVLLAGGVWFRKNIVSYSVFFLFVLVCLLLYFFTLRGKEKAFAYFLSAWALLLSLALVFIMPVVSQRNGLRRLAKLVSSEASSLMPICVMQDNLLSLSLYLDYPLRLAGRNLASCPRPFLLVGRKEDKLPFMLLKKINKFTLYYVR